MDLWKHWKEAVFESFPELYHHSTWAEWEGKGNSLTAKVYGTDKNWYINKAREVEIWNEKSCIYNNIIYPRTGENVPCFGMDLMGFFEKKVIIVFDFQHPIEHCSFSVQGLPKSEGDYRFFEPGNHFSDNIYIAKCTFDEVDEHLETFKKYLTVYRDMLESKKPSQNLMYKTYHDFDKYMRALDPVSGYLKGKFGEEKAESLVDDFLFCYG